MKQQISLNRFTNLIDEDCVLVNDDSCLTENDFYPYFDNRVWKSNIKDIGGGDNFADYCEYFFNVLDEEEYFDN